MIGLFYTMFLVIIYALLAIDLLFPMVKRKYDKVFTTFGGACAFLSGALLHQVCMQAAKILNF